MNEVEAIKDKKLIDKVKVVLKKSSFRDYMLFVMGINTGLRISDLLNLTFRDVIDDAGAVTDTIKVREQKTSKTKTFYVNETVKKALQEYMRDVTLILWVICLLAVKGRTNRFHEFKHIEL